MEEVLKDKILLAHGSGGKLAHELVEKSFLQAFDNPILAKLDVSDRTQAAVLALRHGLVGLNDELGNMRGI